MTSPESGIFSINDQGVIKCDVEPNIVEGCDALNRLRYAMQYYSKFDIINNETDRNIFSNFIMDTYTNFLNDYIHLIDNHSKQLQDINLQLEKDTNLNKCDVKTCKFTSRHYQRSNMQQENNNNDDESINLLNFYIDTMDSLHFYLLHLFDCGLRVKRDENKENEDTKIQENDNDDVFDVAFDRIAKAVNQRKSVRDFFNRFTNCTKFGIDTADKDSSSYLFCDALFEALSKNISSEIIAKLRQYLQDEEFDTESIQDDVAANLNGNIALKMKNRFLSEAIWSFINSNKGTLFLDALHLLFMKRYMNINLMPFLYHNYKIFDMTFLYEALISICIFLLHLFHIQFYLIVQNHLSSVWDVFVNLYTVKKSSFNIGFTFYYWENYRNMKEFPEKKFDNIHDHSGYSPSQLFVEPKYLSFKEEIYNYKYLEVRHYKQEIVPKVNEYIETHKVKRIKSKSLTSNASLKAPNIVNIDYGIKSQTTISFNHLLSITMYCDLTRLCTEFSSTFRPLHNYERLESIKSRNATYYWMSRYLRETVQYFGVKKIKKKKDKGYHFEGPFFCGLSYKLIFPEFHIRLCSPTSTSHEIAIAHKFSKGKGIVVQLNNNIVCHEYLRGFQCDWISSFKEESEVLFCGGHYRIKVESVTDVVAKKSYKKYFSALEKFNSIFIGGFLSGTTVRERLYLKRLFNWKLNNVWDDAIDNKIDKYICDTFLSFAVSKVKVIFALGRMDKLGEPWYDLYNKVLYDFDDSDDIDPLSLTDTSNLFKDDLLKLFDNLQTITIYTSEHGEYRLSFMCLLSLISKTIKCPKIVIKATRKGSKIDKTYNLIRNEMIVVQKKGRDTWLSVLWSSSSSYLIQKYKEKNFKIYQREMKTIFKGRIEESIVIERE